MAFSDQLRKLRQNQGLSQEQLADLVGATTQEVVRWEIGLARPERDKVLRLARLLGCKPEELLPEEPLPETRYRGTGFGVTVSVRGAMPIRERKSRLCLFGIPLYHVGKRARGIFAMGNDALGLIAIGLRARGLLSIGLFSVGVASFGAFSLGALCFGAFALGLAAFGAFALGVLAAGAVSMGVISVGAVAIGGFTAGAVAIGRYFAAGDSARAMIALGSSEAVGTLFRSTSRLTPGEISEICTLLDEIVPSVFRWAGCLIKLFL